MPDPSAPGAAPAAPRWLRLLLLPATLVVFGGLSLLLIRPPGPEPASSPPGVFSAERAMRHLDWLASEPHPLGSAAHTRVRERLVAELEKLGLDVELQHTEVVYDYPRHPGVTRMATVTNVLARRPGTRGSGPALALMAHYDSVPHAPGAADDGSGVITILETLRALEHHPPLENDLLVVITDGEERGLMGAQAFVRQHPWAAELGLVLNFEARGSRGPVFMFETSEGNAPLIRALDEAAPYPLANSLSYAVYRRLPNDTDLSITEAAGIPGLNFAFSDGYYDYHTAGDTPEHLSPASVQHGGSYALALTRYFGDADLATLTAEGLEDATYFDTVGFHLVRYPMAWVPWLSGLALALLLLVVVTALGRGGLRAGCLLRGASAFALQLVLSVAAVLLAGTVLARFGAEPEVRFRLLLARQEWLLAGYLALTLGIALSVWGAASRALKIPGLRRPASAPALSLGALCGWGLLLLLATLYLPGAAYLLTWPLVAALLAHFPVVAGKGPESERESSGALLLLTVGALPGVLWLIPTTRLFFLALGVRQPAMALLPAALLAGLLVPAAVALQRTTRRLASGACVAVGVALLAATAVSMPFNARHPRPVELFVWHDGDAGTTWWASPAREPDVWTRELLGDDPREGKLDEVLPGADGVLWATRAPTLGPAYLTAATPEIEEISTPVAGALRFRLRVPGGAEAVALSLAEAGPIPSASLDGHPVKVQDPVDGWWRWWYFNLPAEGVEIALERETPTEPLEIRVASIAYRWPPLLANRPARRPADRMPRPRSLADTTVVTRSFRLGG
jgi:hypothetical protein